MTAFIDLQTSDGVAVMTLNSPQTRNVLGFGEPSREIEAACARIAADREIRAVVITGAGKAFSAGGDIKQMVARLDEPGREPIDDRYHYKEGIHRIPRALYELEVPTIAAVNGAAIGAGLDLACMCDLRIAAQSATFAESFVKLGIIPGDGGAFLLQRIVGISKAAEMTFTGDAIDAAQALACGLVSQVVADDQLLALAVEKAQRIARARAAHGQAAVAREPAPETGVGAGVVLGVPGAGAFKLGPSRAGHARRGRHVKKELSASRPAQQGDE